MIRFGGIYYPHPTPINLVFFFSCVLPHAQLRKSYSRGYCILRIESQINFFLLFIPNVIPFSVSDSHQWYWGLFETGLSSVMEDPRMIKAVKQVGIT